MPARRARRGAARGRRRAFSGSPASVQKAAPGSMPRCPRRAIHAAMRRRVVASTPVVGGGRPCGRGPAPCRPRHRCPRPPGRGPRPGAGQSGTSWRPAPGCGRRSARAGAAWMSARASSGVRSSSCIVARLVAARSGDGSGARSWSSSGPSDHGGATVVGAIDVGSFGSYECYVEDPQMLCQPPVPGRTSTRDRRPGSL